MRRPGPWAWAGIAVALVLALALFDPYLFTGGDNASYYALAKALATGRGYVDLIAPEHPLHTQYPPGFPLLLVPFYWAFGGSLAGLKLESWIAAGVVLWATWSMARREPGVPAWAGAAAVWLVGLSPVFLIYTHWVLSDMSYTSVAMVALLALRRAELGADPAAGGEIGREPDDSGGWWLAGCLVAVFAFLVRTAGVALLGAPVLVAAARRRWRRVGVALLTAGLGTGAWFAWTHTRPPPTGGYLAQLSRANRLNPESPPVSSASFIGRVIDNVVHYATRDFPRLFWPAHDPPPAAVAFGLLLGGTLLVLGAWTLVRRRGLVTWDVYVILSLALFAVWPWTGDRFFLSVVPLLWLYVLTGLDRAARLVAGDHRPAAAVAGVVAAILLIGAATQAPTQWRATRAWMAGDEMAGYAPFWQDYFRAARWIGENDPQAVITARKPTFAWYWSGRPSFVYPFHGDPERTWDTIRDRGATHILLDPYTRAFLGPTLEPHVDELEVEYAGPQRIVFVLRIKPAER